MSHPEHLVFEASGGWLHSDMTRTARQLKPDASRDSGCSTCNDRRCFDDTGAGADFTVFLVLREDGRKVWGVY